MEGGRFISLREIYVHLNGEELEFFFSRHKWRIMDAGGMMIFNKLKL